MNIKLKKKSGEEITIDVPHINRIRTLMYWLDINYDGWEYFVYKGKYVFNTGEKRDLSSPTIKKTSSHEANQIE